MPQTRTSGAHYRAPVSNHSGSIQVGSRLMMTEMNGQNQHRKASVNAGRFSAESIPLDGQRWQLQMYRSGDHSTVISRPVDGYLLLVCQRGQCQMVIGQEVVKLNTFEQVVVFSNDVAGLILSPDTELSVLSGRFANPLESVMNTGGQAPMARLDSDCLPHLLVELSRLTESDINNGLGDAYFNLIDGMIACALPDSRRLLEVCRPLEHPALQCARQWMIDHIRQPLQTDDLASECRLSTRSLYNLFHRELGQTPGSYFRCLKLEFAWQDLINGRVRSVTESAVDYGFSNLGRFSRQYQEHIGELPSSTLRRGLHQVARSGTPVKANSKAKTKTLVESDLNR